ncbi:hypothetical protein EZS27_031797 [termite gut metagenome]|uniref:DUF4294 domain-containing protein n=1 Tax=termite gut metagenome TaxID=433724 RepID=A0A5J4Q934_9ZZZZ
MLLGVYFSPKSIVADSPTPARGNAQMEWKATNGELSVRPNFFLLCKCTTSKNIYFCSMNCRIVFILVTVFLFLYKSHAQEYNKVENGFLVPVCVYQGDTIPYVQLPEVYIFKPLLFKNEKERQAYNKLIRDVKKTLPISKEVKQILVETYEYMQTLPDKKSKQAHIKIVEKGVKEQYTARMKKLTFSQGKLLIKLIDRECNQTSYELIRAFMGSFKAGFYQAFAGVFGASLKKGYDPQGEDWIIERVILMVENGQI